MRKQFGGDLQSEVNSNTAQILKLAQELEASVEKLQKVI